MIHSLKIVLLICVSLIISLACGQLTHTEIPVITNNTPATNEIAEPVVVKAITIEHAEMDFYDISGSTEIELRNSINATRPPDPYGSNESFDANTNWRISWNWDGYGQEECNLESAVVSYEIKISFPRWDAPVGASPELINKWNTYIENLALHEKGHVDIAIKYYSKVKTAIQNASCLTADRDAQNVLTALRQSNKEYDAETNHGATQGAIFP